MPVENYSGIENPPSCREFHNLKVSLKAGLISRDEIEGTMIKWFGEERAAVIMAWFDSKLNPHPSNFYDQDKFLERYEETIP